MSLRKSSSTVSAAGAGRPGAAAYSPLIKGGMEGACDAFLLPSLYDLYQRHHTQFSLFE